MTRYTSAWCDGLVLVLWTVDQVPWQELGWLFDTLREAHGHGTCGC